MKHQITVRSGDFSKSAWFCPGEGFVLHDSSGKLLALIPFTEVEAASSNVSDKTFEVHFRDGRVLAGTADESVCLAVANIAQPAVRSEPMTPPENVNDGGPADN